ncbi:MAG: DUF1800 domain-containing protein [Burkholderiales bacterium]|nr:DUF1800 domain-containing protein [Anaerolineae bacterium]
MTLHRRQFLQLLGAGGAAAVSMGPLAQALANAPQGSFRPAAQVDLDPVMHVINRLTYGPTPELVDYVRGIGVEAFIEEQLSPDAIDDSALVPHMAEFDLLNRRAGELAAEFENNRQQIANQLIGGQAMRALYSRRQLYEVMVDFWNNHFSVYAQKGPVIFLVIDSDRDAIRPNALGTFRALLGASAHSAAMLTYLDNIQNNRSGPNENYAREMLELHTLGVYGGYTEDDVKEVARAFTGWSIVRPRNQDSEIGEPGTFVYRPFFHDPGEKIVLGHSIPESGQTEGDMVLDIVAAHPSTAQFITTKLVRRFVSDSPPPTLVQSASAIFTQTGGDIPSVLRAIFNSQEFWSAPPKFKRPFEFSMSVLRALAYNVDTNRPFIRSLVEALEAMGHVPFNHAAPDGYPDVAAEWQDNLLNRWNVAVAAASNTVPGASANTDALIALLDRNGIPLETAPTLDFMGQYLFGRSLTPEESAVVNEFALAAPGGPDVQIASGLALLLASPAFQYR